MVGRCGGALVVERVKRNDDIALTETPLRGITAFKYTENSWVPAD
jgi:hypothetical protein